MTFAFASPEDAQRGHALIDKECERLGIETIRSRQDMVKLPAIAELGTDSVGLPLALSNAYVCPDCGNSWTDEWSCAVDDECSACGASSSPQNSDYRIPESYEALFELLPEIPW